MKKRLLSDIELFNLIKANDYKAFEELYNRYWEELYKAAHKRLQDERVAEEIVQEVFVNLYVKKDTLQGSTNIKAYMHTVTKYKVIDEIRKRISEKKYIDSFASTSMVDFADAHNIFEKKELKRHLKDFTDTLPQKCKEVFALKQEELTNKEIAKKLNISEKTVEGHISRARRLIKIYFRTINLSIIIFSTFF